MEELAAPPPQPTSSAGTYVLRELIKGVDLAPSTDDTEGSHITCVDAWNGNLYIGTSAGEVLHYVSIPSEDPDSRLPSYIFATKLAPSFATQQQGSEKGVKQFLLLPGVGKACILCNGTLTFYTLPELSPAFGGRIKQSSCTWVGGLNLDEQDEETDNSAGTVIVICLKQRLRLIRIGKDPTKIRDIELGGVTALRRRGDVACVADGVTYSLLDVVNQRKNDLFPISSLSAGDDRPASGAGSRGASASPAREGRSHQRKVSLNAAVGGNSRLRPDSTSPWPGRSSSHQDSLREQSSSREPSPAGPQEAAQQTLEPPSRPEGSPQRPLPPNIVSPTASEFLLTTGTRAGEPGVGMFVNMDGDACRAPIEFSSYPQCVVLDGESASDGLSTPGISTPEAYVLALVRRTRSERSFMSIEIQPWDAMMGQEQRFKQWLDFDAVQTSDDGKQVGAGLRIASSTSEVAVSEVGSSLRLRRLAASAAASEADTKRNAEEDKFTARFSHLQANILFYARDTVSWLTRNPLVVQLERQLQPAIQSGKNGDEVSVDVGAVQRVINSIRGQEPRDELEFLTLTYIRQKTSLLLFGHLILQTADGVVAYERDKRLAEEALTSGNLDPRVVLFLVPSLKDEIQEGKEGIWIAQGVRDTALLMRDSFDEDKLVQDPKGAYGDNLLPIIKRYLFTWRKKKGFGSVADEAQVFCTVDASLLRVLLMLDQNSPRGQATPGSVRSELNDVVDKGVDCFDRAVELFESFNRLYMLSRLYQSRKMVAKVLATWKRILEGEKDTGGEFIEGEQSMRKYLTNIRDQILVQQYGGYLANRHPSLGVQVFADDNSRVKFAPPDAVAILKREAPGAVKDYLEHLVFTKNHTTYVNDLIAFYLDTVLSALSTSPETRTTLRASYASYRALRAPKPTYRQFLEDNPLSTDPWWPARLRLLQLIGGSHGPAAGYDVAALGAKLQPCSAELVPEMIILSGREGSHEQALQLLTHGLGDYDTAIRYCLLGGRGIFHPAGPATAAPELPSKEEQAVLFRALLHAFLRLEDLSERLERTAELLERFGPWFELGEVLALVPDDWSVGLVEGFLVRALRALVREKRESGVVRALEGARNLRESAGRGEKMKGFRPVVVREGDGEEGGGNGHEGVDMEVG